MIDDEKKKLKDILQQAERLAADINNEAAAKALAELRQDINESLFTVVVVGEFKRGKSTFVNALLGRSLLPMDVLPETATINALMYSEEPQLSVVYRDGHEEAGEASYDYLKRFSAKEGADAVNDIKYIKLGYPNELLKNRVVLVDTPGVSDLNEQRSEVTYHFIPKANAVLFLLDAMSPLKKTEKDFIEERLLPFGVNNIIFVANRYDGVDEDEEPDYLADLKQRLLNAFQMDSDEAELRDITLYPLSATMALQGIERNDDNLLATSGLPELKDKLNAMLHDGNMEKEKVLSYRHRLQTILWKLLRHLENESQLKRADKSSLEEMSQKLTELLQEAQQNKDSITGYTRTAKEKIYAMADKSINYFSDKLIEDVTDMVEAYQGVGFKEYVEGPVSKHIKRNFENWTAVYSPHIDELIGLLEVELARGLSYHFRQNVRVETTQSRELETGGFIMSLEAEDISGVNVQAGAIAAVSSIGLMALVGGTLMPLVGFAALPYLRDKMMKERLAAAKAAIMPEMESQLAQFMLNLREIIHQYIDRRCDDVCKNTEYAYESVLSDMKERIDAQIAEVSQQGKNVEQDIFIISEKMTAIQNYLEKLTV